MSRRLPLWCAVPAGVLAAHAIGYYIAYRGAQYRADVLSATGHSYLGHAAVVATIAAAVAVSMSVARGVRETRSTHWWDAALRISVLQTASFFFVEVLERIAAGVQPFSNMSRVIVIGTVVQVVMGALVAAVLYAFERAGRTIAAVVRAEVAPRRTPGFGLVASNAHAMPARVCLLADSARSPPLLLVSA